MDHFLSSFSIFISTAPLSAHIIIQELSTILSNNMTETITIFYILTAPLSAHIIIQELSTILSNNMSETITIGQHANVLLNSSLTIKCPSNGEPKPKLRWSVSTKPEGKLIVSFVYIRFCTRIYSIIPRLRMLFFKNFKNINLRKFVTIFTINMHSKNKGNDGVIHPRLLWHSRDP